MTARRGELIQVDPPGPTLVFQYNPESLVRSGRMPKLSQIDRPRRVAAQEWAGKTPFRIRFTLLLDGLAEQRSVAPEMARLEGFAAVHPNQPPRRLRLRYSGFSPVLYVIESLDWGDSEIRRADLAPIRAEATVTLVEWQTAEPILTPAQRQQDRPTPTATPPAARTYTVRAGDTLWAIAQAHLGAGKRFAEIASLNNLRDPNRISVGQVLRIPPR